MIDVMDKHFQDYLHLTKAQSAWVQFAHYFGYFLMALPAGLLARRIGYRGAIISGLLIVAAGGLWFIAATNIGTFWAFLLGVAVISMGLTVLETVANPYTTVLGAPQFGASRINLAQSFNGVGFILGPIVGGMFFYSEHGAEVAHQQLYIPYVIVAGIVLVLAIVFYFVRIPDVTPPSDSTPSEHAFVGKVRSLWQHRHFAGGVAAQFFYVAAQAGIFSFFINYAITEIPAISSRWVDSWVLGGGTVMRDGQAFISEEGAARILGLVGFGLFLAGRFTGASLLRIFPAHRVLGTYGLINVVLCAIVLLRAEWLSVTAVMLSFFFMSIMFPTIFALAIYGLGEHTKKASAFIIMAILGGAIMPKLMGYLGDLHNMSFSFIMPLACFALIAIYGFCWRKLSGFSSPTDINPTRGH
jgi:FHS family L-fucose permease-like MFS transporter